MGWPGQRLRQGNEVSTQETRIPGTAGRILARRSSSSKVHHGCPAGGRCQDGEDSERQHLGKLDHRVARRLWAALGVGLWLISAADVGDRYGPVAWALGALGVGMGLAMAPATDSIMGSLPTAKAGVGSAMNTTTRQVGGALGVAVLGSVLTSAYRDQLAPALGGLPAQAAALAATRSAPRSAWPPR
jgi:hypothetical protein